MEEKKAEPKAKVEVKKKAEPKKDVENGTFIMKVTHLAWGSGGKNHFYSKKKPLINAKVMGKFANTLKVWLDKGWIEKGSYKK